MSTKVYDIITKTIIQKLDQGVVPWRKPWQTSFKVQKNLLSGKAYRGINQLITLMSPYDCPLWLGRKQVKEQGYSIKKDEKYTPCFFAIFGKDEDDNEDHFKGIAFHQIFNLEQLEGAEHLIPKPEKAVREIPVLDQCETVIGSMQLKPEIITGGDRAYYKPLEDTVTMPERGKFESPEEYYHVLFHELGHATGHHTRLNRFQDGAKLAAFGSKSYSREELVAEFSAAFVSGHCGIENIVIDNSAAYIDGWRKLLREDNKCIYIAAQQAQKSADYILGVSANTN